MEPKLSNHPFFFGTAGWTVAKEAASHFPAEGTHLERYAQVFKGVEINSSFYREHKGSTYQKWAESVPEDFRFSIKLSKAFTHLQKLQVTESAVHEVFTGIRELGEKWGCLLVQLPPSLQFDEKIARPFFEILRRQFAGSIAFEPRHKTWVDAKALKVFKDFSLIKVFADPEPVILPDSSDLHFRFGSYFRLHGTPVIYKSNYTEKTLQTVAKKLVMAAPGKAAPKKALDSHPQWCIFDNTTFGFATLNAVRLSEIMTELLPLHAGQKPKDMISSAHA